MRILFYVLTFIVAAFVLSYLYIYSSCIKNSRWFKKTSPEGKFADSNGKKINYRVRGKGGAVVVVINAIGSCQAEWWPIQNEIGLRNRMITWDRSGYGWSTSQDEASTASAISEELNIILKFEKIRKPIILVADSTSTFFAMHYATTHPEKVSAVLLINSLPLRYSEWIDTLNNIDECPSLLETAEKKRFNASKGLFRIFSPFKGYKLDRRYKRHIIEHYTRTENYDTMKAEISQLENCLNEIRAAGDFPQIPIKVIYSASESLIRDWVRKGMNEYSARQLGRVQEELSRDILSISPNSTSMEIEGSGEFIHLSKPDIIVSEINNMILENKKKKKGIN